MGRGGSLWIVGRGGSLWSGARWLTLEWGAVAHSGVGRGGSLEGDSMERYPVPEGCFHIIAPGQPKFAFNTSSISPLYETSYKNIIFYYKQIQIMSMPQ